jgi:uncharacterized membrane protein
MKPESKNELIIARFLSLAMWLSTIVILVGVVMLFLLEGHSVVDLGHFQAINALTGQALSVIGSPRPTSVILVGLILLILTPVLRVALTMILFAREKDFIYVALSAAVLTIVITALLGA